MNSTPLDVTYLPENLISWKGLLCLLVFCGVNATAQHSTPSAQFERLSVPEQWQNLVTYLLKFSSEKFLVLIPFVLYSQFSF